MGVDLAQVLEQGAELGLDLRRQVLAGVGDLRVGAIEEIAGVLRDRVDEGLGRPERLAERLLRADRAEDRLVLRVGDPDRATAAGGDRGPARLVDVAGELRDALPLADAGLVERDDLGRVERDRAQEIAELDRRLARGLDGGSQPVLVQVHPLRRAVVALDLPRHRDRVLGERGRVELLRRLELGARGQEGGEREGTERACDASDHPSLLGRDEVG